MNKAAVPLRNTRLFSELLLDYLDEVPGLKSFYNLPPRLDSYAKLIQDRNFDNSNRGVLADVISSQYKKGNIALPTDSKVAANIAALKNENTFTVTTGHQLNVLTGPLYFIYKILTTVRLAEELQANYPTQHFVPVYWMASEDHDFAEISEVYFFGKKLHWNLPNEYSGAVGRTDPKSLAPLLDEVEALFKNDERAKGLLQIFRNAYLNSSTLADATRKFVHELFGKYGLLVLDPDSAELKKAFIPIIQKDVLERKNFSLINDSTAALQQQYKTQVNPREINFFYLTETSRERIVFEDGVYKVLNTSLQFSESEMKDKINLAPELFSPNVVMRPLYQEVVMPNLAYIGGPAEVAYWLQLKKAFDENKIPFPALHLRAHFLLAGKSITNKLQAMKLDFADLFADEQQLSSKFKTDEVADEGSLTTEIESFRQLYGKISGSIGGKLEKELISKFHASFKSQLEMLKTIDRELVKYQRSRFGNELEQIAKLKEKLFPAGQPQERVENILAYYSFFPNDFVESVHDATDAFKSELQVIASE